MYKNIKNILLIYHLFFAEQSLFSVYLWRILVPSHVSNFLLYTFSEMHVTDSTNTVIFACSINSIVICSGIVWNFVSRHGYPMIYT